MAVSNELTLARRLRDARIRSGLSQSEVARFAGLPRPAISLIESGRRSVSSVELAQFARVYATSPDRLLETEAAHDRALGSKQLLAYFRATGPLAAQTEDWLAGELEYCERYAELESAVYGTQRYEMPTYRVTDGVAHEQGERLAWQERRRLGLGNSPVRSMIDLLEGEGVKLRVIPFAVSAVSGCYVYSTELGPCVFINKCERASRQRFTAAHEYAHFLVDRAEAEAELCDHSKSRSHYEVRANTFAAAFLLPVVGVEEALNGRGKRRGDAIDATDAIDIAFRFGASYEAVLWRLRNLGWLRPDEREMLAALPAESIWRSLGYEGEPGDREGTPDRFKLLAIEAWRLGHVDEDELARMIGAPLADVRDAFVPAATARKPRGHAVEDPDWY